MSDKTETETKQADQKVSEIDKAIKAAQARKANKAAAGTAEASATTPEPKAPAKPKMTEEEKAAKLAEREAARAARKTERDAARAAKLAEREANRAPAHMKKVQKAAEKLSPLGQAAELLFNEATANLTAADLASLAAHIQHFNRVKSTERAAAQKLEIGQTVNIVGGDPRFIGKSGTLAKVQRIRCYVKVEGFAKDVYLFTSDVTPVAPAASESAEAASA